MNCRVLKEWKEYSKPKEREVFSKSITEIFPKSSLEIVLGHVLGFLRFTC